MKRICLISHGQPSRNPRLIRDANCLSSAGYDVTGSRLNLRIGQVTTTSNANVDLTGIRLNLTTGSANITAWAEVQTGANNTWTPVDLAA